MHGEMVQTKPAYLVVDTWRQPPVITRCAQSWPRLNAGEIAVRVQLVIGENLQPVHVVTVDDPEAVVASMVVTAEPPEEDNEE